MSGFSFAHPLALLLLVLPVFLGAWEILRRGHRVALPFDHRAPKRRRWLTGIVTSANLLPALILAVAIVILAGPRREDAAAREKELTNIHLCLDVSGSMTAPFGDGSRYDGAMKAITEFTTYRDRDAFGLTVFGNEVLHWVPVTKDLSAIRLSTPFLRPERMPPYFGGTQIGKALLSCRDVLRQKHEGDRMIILVSDGQSADLGPQRSQEVATELKAERIVVYPIHVGGDAVPQDMYTLASFTGGEVFAAGDPAALQTVFQRIDQMQAAKLKPPGRHYVDYFEPFAIAGVVIVSVYGLSLFGVRYTPW